MSTVNDLLYMAHRLVDPCGGSAQGTAAAFAHEPLDHYGISVAMQRKNHEDDSEDGAHSYDGWITPENFATNRGLPDPLRSTHVAGRDRHQKYAPGNTWISPISSSADRIKRANLTIAVLQQGIARQVFHVPEAQESKYCKLANAYRERMTVVLAARVIRKELSWSRLRTDISEQKEEELNKLNGVRIFPTFVAVRKVWEQIFLKIAHGAGVEVFKGEKGEVAYWPLRLIIKYFLDDADLFSTLRPPLLEDSVCVVLTPVQLRSAETHGTLKPLTITGDGATLLDSLTAGEAPDGDLADLQWSNDVGGDGWSMDVDAGVDGVDGANSTDGADGDGGGAGDGAGDVAGDAGAGADPAGPVSFDGTSVTSRLC